MYDYHEFLYHWRQLTAEDLVMNNISVCHLESAQPVLMMTFSGSPLHQGWIFFKVNRKILISFNWKYICDALSDLSMEGSRVRASKKKLLLALAVTSLVRLWPIRSQDLGSADQSQGSVGEIRQPWRRDDAQYREPMMNYLEQDKWLDESLHWLTLGALTAIRLW